MLGRLELNANIGRAALGSTQREYGRLRAPSACMHSAPMYDSLLV